jgi:hypothetical protein
MSWCCRSWLRCWGSSTGKPRKLSADAKKRQVTKQAALVVASGCQALERRFGYIISSESITRRGSFALTRSNTLYSHMNSFYYLGQNHTQTTTANLPWTTRAYLRLLYSESNQGKGRCPLADGARQGLSACQHDGRSG